MKGKIKCKECSNMIPIDAPYCIFCGAKQTPQGAAPENKKRRRKKQPSGMAIVKAGEDVVVPVTVEDPQEQEKRQTSVPDREREKQTERSTSSRETCKETQEENCRPDTQETSKKPERQPQKPYSGYQAHTAIRDTEASEYRDRDVRDRDDERYEEPRSRRRDDGDDDSGRYEESASRNRSYEEDRRYQEDDQYQDEPYEDDEESEEDSKKRGIGAWKDKKEKKAEEYEKSHDSLTGLLNKRTYEEKLMKVRPENICIIIGDVNDLKKVNEMNGEEDGDLLLTSVAEAFRQVFGNYCYRIGEDEFAVILEKINESTIVSRIGQLQDEIKRQERKVRASGKQIDMKVAIGYAYGNDDESALDVANHAAAKMRNDKNRMKQVYNPNYDGYYNDVKAEYEEVKIQLDRENIHKIIMVLIGFAAFMAFYFIFLT